MCLIAYQAAGSEPLLDEWLENGWDHNPHGAGFMFASEGKVVIRKGFYKLKELKAAYARDFAAYGSASPFITHFRWATHGSKAEQNLHPHPLADGMAGLAHNGVLGQFEPPCGVDISDTVLFCRTVLAMRPAEQLTSENFGKVLAEMIGAGNKLAIMDGAGGVSIVNVEAGIWHEGYWFSNGDFSAPPKRSWSQTFAGVTRGIVFGTPAPTPPAAIVPPLPALARGRESAGGMFEGHPAEYLDDEASERDAYVPFELEYLITSDPRDLSDGEYIRLNRLIDCYYEDEDNAEDQQSREEDALWDARLRKWERNTATDEYLDECAMDYAMRRDGR